MNLPPTRLRDRLRYAWLLLRAPMFIIATKRPGENGRLYFQTNRDFGIDVMQEVCDYWNTETVGAALAKLTQEEEEE